MRAHLAFLATTVRHKWNVGRVGLRLGVPVWRLVVHDWSRFTPSEWFAYVERHAAKGGRTVIGNPAPPPISENFRRAFLVHIHRNPHHWQHWCARGWDGSEEVLPMPEVLVREMVADWAGSGFGISLDRTRQWYARERDVIKLHPEARALAERLLDSL